MRKICLFVTLAFVALMAKAQQPSITLTSPVDGNTRNLVFATSVAGTKLQIDWGDGVLVETEEIAVFDDYGTSTTVTGTPVNEGAIKIYGDNLVYFDCSYAFGGTKVTSLDVSNAVDLQRLDVYSNALTSLDLSKNVKLTRLDCYGNPMTELDLSANTALTRLDAKDMSLTSIDLSHNTALTYVSLNNTPVGTLDLSSNTSLSSLYLINCGLTSIDLSANTALTYVSLNNNRLTSLDVTSLPKLGTLFCLGNALTELKADNVTKSLNCSKNNLTLATLPTSSIKTYTYAPQNAMAIAENITAGEKLDLSAQTNVQGVAAEAKATVYTWKTTDGTVLTAGEDYTEADGVFTFLKAQPTPVYCEMTTDAFPKFTGVNAFKTTEITVSEAQQPAITLTSPVDGNTRNLVFATSVAGTKLQIDWGDGVLVETEEIAVFDDYGTSTTVTGTPVNEGAIKIYGDNLAYFDCSYAVGGTKVTSLDVSNAVDLQRLDVYSNALTSLDLSKNVKLNRLDCYANPITELDLSANTALTRLDAKDMSLTSIDLSHNTALTYVSLNNTPVGTLDLSANTSLASLYLINCGLASIDLSANTALTFVNLNNNLLTTLDVTSLPQLGTLFCMGNALTELKADNVTKSLNCSKNNLTLATLPTLSIKTYTYAPQNAMSIVENITVGETLDLSAQTNVQGVAAEAKATVYTWKTTDGTMLTAGEDYTEADGVFTFLKAQPAPVYCEMTTDAFPKFTGVNAFKTTEITVGKADGIAETGIESVKVLSVDGAVKLAGLTQGDEVAVYNMAGVRMAQVRATASTVEMPLPAGVYAVSVNGRAYKVIVK